MKVISLFIVTVSVLGLSEASPRCFECTDMPHPQDCPIVTTCSSHEICYVEQFVTSGGQVLYNSGCLSKDRCMTGGKRAVPFEFKSTFKRHQGEQISTNGNIAHLAKRQNQVSGTDIATCIQCCDGNFCNIEGCGTTAVARPNRGPKCFSCPAQANPESCRDTQLCDIDQVCALYKPLDRLTRDEWASECMGELQCKGIVQVESAQLGSFVGKRDVVTVNKCPRCCTDDLCNYSCRQNLTVTQPTAIPTKPITYPTIKLAPASATTNPTTKSAIKQSNLTTSQAHHTTKIAYPTTKNAHHTSPQAHPTTINAHHTTKQAHPTTKNAHHTTKQAHHTTKQAHHTTKQAHPTTKQVTHTTKQVHPTTKQAHHTTQQAHHTTKQAHPTTKQVHHTTKQAHPTTKQVHHTTQQAHHTTQQAHHTTKQAIKLTTSSKPIPTTDPAVGCKVDGYVYDPPTKLCLKFHQTPNLNWTQAQAHCNSTKGQLAIITDEQKIKDVLRFYKDFGYTRPLWVGATDFGNGHVFTFTDGSKLTVDPSAGKDLTNSNCLYVTGGSYKGYGPCSDKHGFICERSSTIRA